MNTTDQWFTEGEKVMRIAYAPDLGLPTGNLPLIPETDFGRVLCVSRCERIGGSNSVFFVGVKSNTPTGFYARCFRRVSEIQLCVRAAKRLSEPVETETQNA